MSYICNSSPLFQVLHLSLLLLLHHPFLHLFLLLLPPPSHHHLFLLLFSLFPLLFLLQKSTAHKHSHNHFHLSLIQLHCSISLSLLALLHRLSPPRLLHLQHFLHLPLLHHPPPLPCPWSYLTLRLPRPQLLRMPPLLRSPPSTWLRSRTTQPSPGRARMRTVRAAARAFSERGMSLWCAPRTSARSR